MTLETVFAAVDSLEEATLGALRELVARPSVAGSAEELVATAELVADPIAEWDTPPFVPTIREGALFGEASLAAAE